ncbi:unnamed protein product [Phaedon cochleariae]|uniref:Nuclear cap-binding protein subunit 3 n=1 Tax=Phaedon cochleariae TaxID=80249 RepID=A0A9P0GSI5_PHACE|nr:unnamed protein product [Phaedon cochleariae]
MTDMIVEVDKTRPNIRIEIQNEKMDVDESEEGEIVDDDSDNNTAIKVSSQNIGNVLSTKRSVFTTGINIFDDHEQKKRQERAKRFALKPEEIHNFSEADVEELYESLGITDESDPNIRFDALHLLGIAGLTAENILDYFAKYAPTSLEWIDADSCNVLWMDHVTAARAIFYTSKAVRGMPAREQVNTFAKEFMDDVDNPEENTGQSILLRNRQVELKIDDVLKPSKINPKNSVDISEITIPIPPGYWRLGGKCPKSNCLLMRFALRTDKKPYRAETLAKYYKKLANSKSIIDEGKKKEIRGIFERNKELNDKNPWGSLARNWDHDAKFREQIPNHVDEPQVEVKNPSLLVRLGRKKVEIEPEDKEEVEEEEAEESPEESPPRSKGIPRMRMYADEEEEKVRRKKLLQTIKTQSDKLFREETRPRDLRNILSVTNYKEPVEIIDLVLEEDLGKKLKNRSKHMVYSVEHGMEKVEPYERKENVRSADIRAVLEERRIRSPEHRKREYRRSPAERKRSRSPIRRYAVPVGMRSSPSRERRRFQYRDRSPHRTLHSDRMSVRRRKRNTNYSDDDSFTHKPRSKVAVVIKTQKKPTVASTIWSRVQRKGGDASEDGSESSSGSESASDSDSEAASESERSGSSSSSGSESESESSSSSASSVKKIDRPGFRRGNGIDRRDASLKITMSNDRYRR